MSNSCQTHPKQFALLGNGWETLGSTGRSKDVLGDIRTRWGVQGKARKTEETMVGIRKSKTEKDTVGRGWQRLDKAAGIKNGVQMNAAAATYWMR